MVAAAEAFNDSARPAMGMVTRWHWAIVSWERPLPSLPMNTAQGPWEKSTSVTGKAALSGTEASSRKPSPRSRENSPWRERSRESPRRNTAPIEARSALGERGSQQSPSRTTRPMPRASAVRRMVPRLPGSCKSSSTAQEPPPAASPASSPWGHRHWQKTPWGLLVEDSSPATWSATR